MQPYGSRVLSLCVESNLKYTSFSFHSPFPFFPLGIRALHASANQFEIEVYLEVTSHSPRKFARVSATAVRERLFPLVCHWRREAGHFQACLDPRSIYSTVNGGTSLTTEQDGLAAPRRASHCSSYVALNLPSPSSGYFALSASGRVRSACRLKFTFHLTDYRRSRVTPSRNVRASVSLRFSAARGRKEFSRRTVEIFVESLGVCISCLRCAQRQTRT